MALTLVGPWSGKVGHLQPIYLSRSRLGRSLEELQVIWPAKCCQAKQLEDKNVKYINRQEMELFMTKNVTCIYYVLNLAPHLLEGARIGSARTTSQIPRTGDTESLNRCGQ